jgi:hypothetical protein
MSTCDVCLLEGHLGFTVWMLFVLKALLTCGHPSSDSLGSSSCKGPLMSGAGSQAVVFFLLPRVLGR